MLKYNLNYSYLSLFRESEMEKQNVLVKFLWVRVKWNKRGCLPSIVPADPPYADGVDGLCVQCVQALWINELQGTIVQVHEEIFTLYTNKGIIFGVFESVWIVTSFKKTWSVSTDYNFSQTISKTERQMQLCYLSNKHTISGQEIRFTG